MFVIIGYIFLLACVFGAYAAHGGELMVLWQPTEFIIIFGGGIGAMIVGYGGKPLKVTLKAVPTIFKASPYKKSFFMDLFAMQFEILTKVRKEGLMSIEGDVDAPHDSALFTKYPTILADHHLIDFMTDYLRLMVGGNLNAFEIENLMDVELDTHHHEAAVPAGIINKLADGLPAFGIVAAVMGVVHTMGSLFLPPAELGLLIGAALVGTFLGILLSYGVVGPIASAMEVRNAGAAQALSVVKVTLLASLNGYAPQVAIEFGRKAVESSERPGFLELEAYVKDAKNR